MDESNKSKVYVMADEENRITRIEGGYTEANIADVTKWILLDEGYGDKYNLCQSLYLEGGIRTGDGICRYELANGQAVLRSDEAIEADREAMPKPQSLADKLGDVDDAITEIQMAMAETYETDDSALTDLQMAVAELYEMITGGAQNG